MLLQEFLSRKAADSAFMEYRDRTAHAYSKMQGQKSLTLCCHSFLKYSRNVATTIIVLKGGR